ncbi:MAG: S1 RNA-binding domain-containing protein, partial [Anaerolineales bacterium]
MTVPGEVTFKVKQFVAARERFTTGQVTKLTGLNHKSVETVVQRLIRDGYVVKSRETAPGTGRGRRPLYYTLTTDIEKRKELVNEVSAFQPGAAPVRIRPLSANYIGAHEMLDELEREPDAPDREARLAKIEKHLELAAFEEGLEDGEEGTAVVRAYLLRERARVAALRHQWVEAERLLGEVHRVFEEHGLEEEVEKTNQYRFTLLIRQRLTVAKDDEEVARIWREIPSIVQEVELVANPVVQLTVGMSKVLSVLIASLRKVEEITNRLAEQVPFRTELVPRRLEEGARFTLDWGRHETRTEQITKEDYSVYFPSVYSMEELLEESYAYKSFQRGNILEGVIVSASSTEILIDIGAKTTGIVSSRELERMGPEAIERLKVDDEVPVYVLNPEDKNGNVILSLSRAQLEKDWQAAQEIFEAGECFEATVSGYNKGGLIVRLGKVRGFVSASQLAPSYHRSQEKIQSNEEYWARMVGQQLQLKIIELDRRRNRLILSERAA